MSVNDRTEAIRMRVAASFLRTYWSSEDEASLNEAEANFLDGLADEIDPKEEPDE